MRVIAGEVRGRRLKEPANREIRPTTDKVKEAIFSAIQFEIEGRRVLDLFAGTGQMGIEALSRGARQVVFTDESPAALRIVQENVEICGFQNLSLIHISPCAGGAGFVFKQPVCAERGTKAGGDCQAGL